MGELDVRRERAIPGRNFIGVGRTAVVPATESTDMAYHLLPARDSAGMLMSEIPVLSKPAHRKLAASGAAGENSSDGWIGVLRNPVVEEERSMECC